MGFEPTSLYIHFSVTILTIKLKTDNIYLLKIVKGAIFTRDW